jgi:two-component system response regulator FlrC
LISLDLEYTLTQANFSVRCVTSGEEALDASSSSLAAAIVDLRLNGTMDGREVISRLRRRQPGLPVIVVTGFSGQAPEADLRGLGGPTARLQKPWNTEELVEKLRAITASLDAVPARAKADGRRSVR